MIRVSQAVDRDARITEIKRQIAEGTYETPEKLAAALDAFLTSQEQPQPNLRPADLPRPPRPR